MEVVNSNAAMRAFTDSFIVSNPGQNYTVWHIPLKTDFFKGKIDCHSLKNVF